MKLVVAVCLWSLIAPVLMIVEIVTGASYPMWLFAIPVFVYLVLFVILLVDVNRRGG